MQANMITKVFGAHALNTSTRARYSPAKLRAVWIVSREGEMDIDVRNVLMAGLGELVIERGQNEHQVVGVWVRQGAGGPGVFIRADECVQIGELLCGFGDDD